MANSPTSRELREAIVNIAAAVTDLSEVVAHVVEGPQGAESRIETTWRLRAAVTSAQARLKTATEILQKKPP